MSSGMVNGANSSESDIPSGRHNAASVRTVVLVAPDSTALIATLETDAS